MQQPLLAVHDIKTNLYDQPFALRSPADAVRQFEHLRAEPNTKFNKNPEDFRLMQIGFYDDETGQVQPLDKHVVLCSPKNKAQ